MENKHCLSIHKAAEEMCTMQDGTECHKAQ